jgi:hypothetical protein
VAGQDQAVGAESILVRMTRLPAAT